MKAVSFLKGDFKQVEWRDLKPNADQLLVQPLAIGICGSDLSAVEHTEDFLESVRQAGSIGQVFNPEKDLVLGHEFTAKVVEVGENVTDYEVGDYIVALPWVLGEDGISYTVGYSNDYPGGLSEKVLLGNGGHFKIPNDVNPYHAAVTEPLATGYNSVLRSDIEPSTGGALITGAGTVGLGAVIALASKGISPIVVSDPSEQRRSIAKAYGAHATVNPLEEDPVDVYKKLDGSKRLYVFEASGVKNLIHNMIDSIPAYTKFYVVGASMENNILKPTALINKNISLDFITGPGYGEMEYSALGETFKDLVEKKFDPLKLVTAYAGFGAVDKAFAALRPGGDKKIEHVKILIIPELSGTELYRPEEITLTERP